MMNRRNFIKTTAMGAVAFGFGFQSLTSGCTRNRFDAIIKNGTIFSGDGKPAITGDIGIKDGKIAAIGNMLGESADLIIDAKGLAVSPGFIDIHTHTDTNLFDAPKGDSRIFQGITTDIGGNCGDSPFPYSDEYYQNNKDSMRNGYPFWKDIDGFYEALKKNKIGINYGSYTGHGQLRSAVVGDNNVTASQEQIKKMCKILEKEMEAGCIGMTCGLEYAPGSYASNEEIIELCKVVSAHDGLFAIHMRNEDDRVEEALVEAISIAKSSKVRIEISHLKAQNEKNWHKTPYLLKLIEEAKNSGLDIAFDRYPYIAFSTGLTSFIPLELRDGSEKEILERLEDRAKSDIIGKYAETRVKRLGGPQNVLIASCSLPENVKFSGKNLAECCQISGMELWPMIKHLLLSEKLSVQMAGFAMKEDNLNLLFKHHLSMPASDGSVYSPEGILGNKMPHPRSYGTFPRFFERYVREQKVCDIATAVYKCTGFPASRLRIKNRGLIIPSYQADIVIFNPETIKDTATYASPHQFPEGIEHVFVNGVLTIKDGKHTGKLAGEIVTI